MRDDLRRLAAGLVVELAGVVIVLGAMRVVAVAEPTITITARTWVARARRRWELERDVRRDRNRVIFEAFLATREGAPDGAD